MAHDRLRPVVGLRRASCGTPGADGAEPGPRDDTVERLTPVVAGPQERGVGLRHASRVVDLDPADAQTQEREAHRHPVVVVRHEPRGCRLAGFDGEPVRVLDSSDPAPPQLRDDRVDPVGLLAANELDPAHPCRSFGEHSDRGQRLGGVRDVRHVDVQTAQTLRADDGHAGRRALHDGAHALEQVGELHVALDAVRPEPVDRDAASRDRGGGHEVGGSARVRLDVVVAGGVLRRCDDLLGDVRALDLDAEAVHHRGGHPDVGLGDDRGSQPDAQPVAHQRGGHHEPGDELAREVAGELHRAAGERSAHEHR